ncbi:hypothetical protein FYK55_14700 [Roseiconus nitratireducens]|uniref:Uncharacterized protein n=1 Tax=Roseiconus nitratireducens TaxID=2605748 RepID=A0A5M6D7Y6_9BACT|nr:hypothetical protein [Roseiconus nitratireducens]KAA5542766.1 hypothetical protein FYK55_14700 [Roseiconus nitratireducens]
MILSIHDHLTHFRDDRQFVPCREPAPTNALPGTPEKLEVLKARLEAGEHLHHQDDPKHPVISPPVVDSQLNHRRIKRWCL